jgi:2-phosphosulfolactate phosphatase
LKTTIKYGLSPAKAASGTVVIIDVFRASNTILMLLEQGASSVIPVPTVREAFRLKEANPNYVLAGERKGFTVSGFDMGNSPHEAAQKNLHQRHVIITTSAGTKAIWHAKESERVLIGSFGNAPALRDYLIRVRPSLVTWFAAGTEGVSRAIEDDLCAVYLNQVLVGGQPQDFQIMKERILKGEGAKRLRRLEQIDDFPYCLTTDLFDFVPEVVWPESQAGLCRIVRRRPHETWHDDCL